MPAVKRLGFFLLVFLCLGFAEKPVQGDAFITASIGEPVNLIPLFASDSASAEISRLIFNGLVKYDKDLKLVGDLASSWEVLEGGLRIVFRLKKDVRWQDGAPLTAQDVQFTFQKLTDPQIPSPYAGDFEKVSSFKILDSHTIEVLYKEPFSPGLASWSMGILPKHLLSGENLLVSDFSRKPVGTGPYLLRQWKAGESLRLTANELYFEGRPHIDRVIYRVIPDQSTIFLELLTENLDSLGLTPLQHQKQTGSRFFKERYRKFRYPSPSYTYLGYNLKNPLFADKKVRQAIGMAINKKEIIDVTLFGLGRVATGPFLPTSWAYNPQVRESVFDPARAKILLEEAGWRDSDGDGWLDKDGKKFSFTILTNHGHDQRKMACEMIGHYLKNIGIEVKIQVVEWATFLKEFVDKRKFEAVLLAWQLSPEPDIFDLFHSSRTHPGEFNFVSYANPQVDRLLEEGRRVFGEKERAAVYHQAHEILSAEEVYTFLYVPDALPIVHRRFQGVELSPAGLGHNFIRWFVRPQEQKYKKT
jgi:peptide/nickel transport system substrate-binding protein